MSPGARDGGLGRTPNVGPTALVGFLFLLTLGLAASCSSSSAREPTPTTVNFSPKIVLEVNDDGFVWKPGPNTNEGATIPPGNAPPTVKQGTVMEVRNTGRRDHRVQAGKAFDTGTMPPGQSTVIALTEQLTEPKTLEIKDQEDPAHTTSMTVLPRPQPS